MRLMFAAGDVGGARALAPVANLAATSGYQTRVLQHGAIADDYEDRGVSWTWVRKNTPESILSGSDIEMVVFTSSVADTTALELALSAQASGLPTAHILDNWSNYASRLELENAPRLNPNVYTVMDDLAYDAAVADGVDPNCLVVTGTPALADVKSLVPNPYGSIIFASEPVSMDQGRDPSCPSFRGYTEDQVLAMLLRALQPWAGHVTVKVFPHPRENPARLKQVIHTHSGLITCTIVEQNQKRAALLDARAVVGMSSIFLYEAWLAGLPTLSLQPKLRLPHLGYLEGRPGLLTVYDERKLYDAVNQLLNTKASNHSRQACLERARHQGASHRVLKALADCFAALQKT